MKKSREDTLIFNFTVDRMDKNFQDQTLQTVQWCRVSTQRIDCLECSDNDDVEKQINQLLFLFLIKFNKFNLYKKYILFIINNY